MTSSERKLSNHIVSIELESDKKIKKSDYYIVRITITGIKKRKLIGVAEELCRGNVPKAEELCRGNVSNDIQNWVPPIVVYVCDAEIQLLFSTTEEEHNLGGSHQKICSLLTSSLTLHFNRACSTSIVELENRVLILCYFQCKMCAHSQAKMLSLLPEKHQAKSKFKSLTFSEQMKILKKENVSWDEFDNYEKYGTFVKINNGRLEKFSENIDFTDTEEHESFFFD